VPPYPAEILYAFIIIMVLLGVAISYEFGRFHGSVAYIVMIAYSAYAIYTNEKLGYSAWLKVGAIFSLTCFFKSSCSLFENKLQLV